MTPAAKIDNLHECHVRFPCPLPQCPAILITIRGRAVMRPLCQAELLILPNHKFPWDIRKPSPTTHLRFVTFVVLASASSFTPALLR